MKHQARTLGGVSIGAAFAAMAESQLAMARRVTSAGNGGTGTADANGGAVVTGDLNAGSNAGHVIAIGDSAGPVAVDGGATANATSLTMRADGGAAIADAGGGDNSIAFIHQLDRAPNRGDADGGGDGGDGGDNNDNFDS